MTDGGSGEWEGPAALQRGRSRQKRPSARVRASTQCGRGPGGCAACDAGQMRKEAQIQVADVHQEPLEHVGMPALSGVRTPLLEVVEHDDADGAGQPPERALVQLGPELSAGPADQQAHRLARVAQGQDEEPCPPVLAGRGVTGLSVRRRSRLELARERWC